MLHETVPVSQRDLGADHSLTIKIRWIYARALFADPGATLDDMREAVTTLEDTARTARRVLGGAHPHATAIEDTLRKARAALRARETPSPGAA